MRSALSIAAAAVAYAPSVIAVASQTYTWKNVKIGGGGGFVPGIVFNPNEKGLAYARTDIGGAYKLNSDDTWTPLLDFANDTTWNYWGVDALATDPVKTSNLYLATGMYTNSWDPNNGQILRSSDYGKTFTASKLPFKVGGNMPGRGLGERLAVDPNSNNILFFGARSGHGLWKSTDSGVTWSQVTSFPSTGTYVQDPTDTTGYASDKTGLAWVTFDPTSSTSGKATQRIFVGVANVNSASIFMTTNGGSTWTAVPGQNTTYMPHKGVVSVAEKALYVTANNNAGPYDGTLGAVYRYDITAGTWKDITPVSGSDLYFGFGGLAVDKQKSGTIMVAALNSWYPDGQIFRSNNSGATWTTLQAWADYPNLNRYYKYDTSRAPWISVTAPDDTKQIGWMMESLEIDPFDSNHWLYGTGLTVYGGHDLLKWDTVHNVTLSSLADGIEETSVQNLMSPPSGPTLVSAVGDVGGFVHSSLTTPPTTPFVNPLWSTTVDLDFAGNKPSNFVRLGNGNASTANQVALSNDAGSTWYAFSAAGNSDTGGKIALSANGDTVLWRTSASGVKVSQNSGSFQTVSSLPAGAVIASDKKDNTIFYAASGSSFFTSTDGGKTFTVTGTLGSSTSPVEIAINPGVTKDVWVSTDQGLFHSTNAAAFSTVSGVSQAWAIALGASKSTGGYPALFAAANIGGVGYFRSDDQGVNWVQINDVAHGFGSASSNCLTGDPRTYGRVYIGTNGRGIFVGDASGTAPAPTATTPSTSAPASTSQPVSTSTSKPVTTTTKPISTTTNPSAPSSTAVSPAYGQCGGQGWTGATACVSGFTCTVSNPFYSQCVPS